MLPNNNTDKKYLVTGDLNNINEPFATKRKIIPKLSADKVIKIIMIVSIKTLSYEAMLLFRVLNPPVAMVAKEWQTASKRFIPEIHRAMVSSIVKPK